MIVRSLDDVTEADRDITTPNWRSKRIVLAKEGVGFSVHETVLKAGSVNDFWYASRIEAVFVVDGEGELLDKDTGIIHQLRPKTQMRTVCVSTHR